MLVYGDAERVESLPAVQAEILAGLEEAERLAPGLQRHAALVSAFIRLGEAVQGVADAGFEARGSDTVAPGGDPGMPALLALAGAIDRSWSGGFAGTEPLGPIADAVRTMSGPAAIRTKQAEGYAYYALYPEAFLEAARRSGLPSSTGVIGIRSIGAGLAALVAAALGAPPPLTLRPVGHPFRREVRIECDGMSDWIGRHRYFAVVDEGPGLSGSSFGAVLDWLEGQGVPRERIHVFPSHTGDLGPQASEAHRSRWAGLRRHVVDADALLADRLPAWVADRVGPLDGPLQVISGGAWRALSRRDPDGWPASNLQQERRKFIARSGGGAWLVKFAALGAAGERTLALATVLAEAGWTAPPAGLCHGFLMESWLEGARSLDEVTVERGALIGRLASYLGFRARCLPADRGGASPAELLRMAQHNTRLALGGEAGDALRFDTEALARSVRPVVTDNRMLPHEWLVAEDGRLVKADAVDHHAAHDLVGCQDIAWDVAGAAVEFGLTDEETRRLAEGVGTEAGRAVDPALLAFYRPCYLAYRIGACTMAAQANGADEAVRLEAAADAYAAKLARHLDCAGPRP
jgi:hypothetical protein